jgi:hypothetical protein
VVAAALDAKASGPVTLPDQGLLPDQRHLPRQPDHAALLAELIHGETFAEAAE